MNRRSTLRHLAGASGALLTFPAWARSWDVKSMRLYVSSYNATHQEILSAVTDTIIPSNGKLGAKTTGVDLFLQKLFDKCYEKAVNENIKTQLLELNARALTIYAEPFATCTYEQRIALLNELAASTEKNEKDFFTLIKSETIRISTHHQMFIKIFFYM